MATIGAIAKQRALNEERLLAAMDRIGGQLGIEPAPVLNQTRYSLEQRYAVQLGHVADYAERIADALSAQQTPEEPTLDDLTVAELKAKAEEAGLDTKELKRKADFVAALEQYNARIAGGPATPPEGPAGDEGPEASEGETDSSDGVSE